MSKRIFLKLSLLLLLGNNLFAATKIVKLSDFKPKRDDATPAFMLAINSGAAKVIIDDPGFALQLNAIRLHSNLELIFEDKVIIEAKKNAFKSTGAFLFTVVECNNIILRGKGKVILRMRKKDYQNQNLYKHSEWRHLLGIKGSKNVKISNLTLQSSGGDGIYLGCTSKTPYCKDILLEDLVISDHHRQGISVISAENLIIRRCTITNTSGTPPAAGIDFEPNSRPKGQRIVNCLVEDCNIIGNEGTGLEFYTPYMEGCPPQSINVRNCLIKSNHHTGISITTSFYRKGREKIHPPTGYYKFKNCKIINNHGPAIMVKDQLETVKLIFESCILEVSNNSRSYPVLLAAHHMKESPIGGVIFKDVTISKLPPGREVMPFKSWTSASIANISGDIFIETSNGKKRFPLEKHINKIQKKVLRNNKSKFKPAMASWRKFSRDNTKTIKSTKKLPGIQTRDRFCYIVWAKAGEIINITAKRANPDAIRRVKLKLISPSDKEIFKTELNNKNKIAKIVFTAPETGCYPLTGASGGANMIITSNVPGGWRLYKRPLLIAGKHNKLFFAVPEGTKDFELEVAGSPNAPFIKATVYNEQGKIIDSNKLIEQPYRFKLKRNDNTRQIWSLDIELNNSNEKAFLQQGRSLEGFFAASPDNVLKKL